MTELAHLSGDGGAAKGGAAYRDEVSRLEGGVVEGGELAGAIGFIAKETHGFDDDHNDVYLAGAQVWVGPERVGGAAGKDRDFFLVREEGRHFNGHAQEDFTYEVGARFSVGQTEERYEAVGEVYGEENGGGGEECGGRSPGETSAARQEGAPRFEASGAQDNESQQP